MKNFLEILDQDLTAKKIEFAEFFDETNIVESRLLPEYGAFFVARGGASAPNKIVFKNEREVAEFQSSVSVKKAKIGEFKLELQTAAMNDLLKAVAEAESGGLSINPRGQDAARRNYAGTVELWASRVNPALEHWTNEGKLSAELAEKIRALSAFEQVSEVFKLEEKEIWFSKDLSKSIIYSVAPPGTSQHLAMLAFDVAEFQDEKVREILARNKWFQTVVSDLPHFTYLGVAEKDLPKLGLKNVENNGQAFWIPNI
jgi:hypothetical protein